MHHQCLSPVLLPSQAVRWRGEEEERVWYVCVCVSVCVCVCEVRERERHAGRALSLSLSSSSLFRSFSRFGDAFIRKQRECGRCTHGKNSSNRKEKKRERQREILACVFHQSLSLSPSFSLSRSACSTALTVADTTVL